MSIPLTQAQVGESLQVSLVEGLAGSGEAIPESSCVCEGVPRSLPFVAEAEVPLPGGNVAAEVVRVRATMRKPVTAATPAVDVVLSHLERMGFPGAPRALGRDERGRRVLEHIDGPLAHAMSPEPDVDAVYEACTRVEAAVHRPVNPTILTPEEFAGALRVSGQRGQRPGGRRDRGAAMALTPLVQQATVLAWVQARRLTLCPRILRAASFLRQPSGLGVT